MKHGSYCKIQDKKHCHQRKSHSDQARIQDVAIPTTSFSSTEILWTLSFKAATEVTVGMKTMYKEYTSEKARKHNNQDEI
jgi:hypothetical protein